MFKKYDEIFNSLKPGNEALITYILEKLNGIVPEKEYYNFQGRIIISPKNKDNKKFKIILIII